MKKALERVMIFTALAALLCGCAYFEPMPYVDPNDIMPGPGLFSGESGEFVLTVKE